MDIFICILLIIVGLALIVKGGDWFVDSASWMAKVSGIPTFIIGATIVSLGTTLPEILTSCISSAQGSIDLAVGNAVGSVNANIGLIMGISIVCMPVAVKRKEFIGKALILISAIIALWLCTFKGQLILGLAFLILAFFIVFICENVYSAKRAAKEREALGERDNEQEGYVNGKYKPKNKQEIWKNIIFFVLGAAGIAGGAILLSTYGQKLAIICGIPAEIVGVTIVAIGTSLPELVTTITAIIKKNSELSIGNIVGANIIDITLILPLCAFISGGNLPVNTQTVILDIPFCLFVAAIALVPPLICKRLHRWQGITMLTAYAAYITVLVLITTKVIVLPNIF